jgi:hypothetical protein
MRYHSHLPFYDPYLQVDEAVPAVDELLRLRSDLGRGDDALEISMIMAGQRTLEDIATLEAAGVGQIVVRPWTKGRDAVPNLQSFAADIGLK